MHLYENTRAINRDLVVALAIFLALIILFVFAFSGITHQSDEEEARVLYQAVRRAAVTCYAVEGRYPESLAAIAERYGVTYDQARFVVRYEVIASNLMPNITVTKIGGDDS